MHVSRRASATLLLIALLLAPGAARAGVPRSCIHPTYDPIACPRDTRVQHRQVLPSARLRVLDAQRRVLRALAPLEDRERNALLEDLRDRQRGIR